jgi:A/G-specific adenine glycosylase
MRCFLSTKPNHQLSSALVNEIQSALLHWYAVQARRLPWRDTSDPYAIWVSEVMLQQTQVKTVIPYYIRFMQRFPTISALATASEDELAQAWAGLGYYRRVKNLQAAARQVLANHNAVVPDSWQLFRDLPGVGDYTAGAVLSIAYNKPHVAVDGNVKRVLARMFAVMEPIDKAMTLAQIQRYAEALLPHNAPGAFNQALMEMGALVCTPKRALCIECPVHAWCKARALGMETSLPARLPRRNPKAVTHVSGVIAHGDQLLFQRRAKGVLQGYWELPTRPLEEGEAVESGVGELASQLIKQGFMVQVGHYLGAVDLTFSHQRWQVHLFTLDYMPTDPRNMMDSPYVHESAIGYDAVQDSPIWAWKNPHTVRESGLPVALAKILDKALLST